MGRNGKILVGVTAAFLLLCVLGAVAVFAAGALGFAALRSVQLGPTQVDAAASRIATFNLPPGYAPEATVDLGGFLYVSYAPGDGHSHIIFVQAPPSIEVDQATLEQYIDQAGPSGGSNRHTRTQVVGRQSATICGQAVTLVISEGTNSDGQPYRSVAGLFRARGGPALVSVESPLSRWNQSEVDTFLASIR